MNLKNSSKPSTIVHTTQINMLMEHFQFVFQINTIRQTIDLEKFKIRK